MKSKLSSRKFWTAIVGVIVGLAMIFGLDESVINTIAGAIVSVSSVITYIITEGHIDKESISNAAESVQNAVCYLTNIESEAEE